YSGAANQYAVTWNAALEAWQVTALSGAPEYLASGENTDTLYGIETIEFTGVSHSLTAQVHVFNAGNQLVGTYATIQAANDAPTTLAGYRISVLGDYSDEEAI